MDRDRHTRQDVGESILAHVGRLNGGDDGARLGVVRTQRVPLLLQTILVRQMILHVRLWTQTDSKRIKHYAYTFQRYANDNYNIFSELRDFSLSKWNLYQFMPEPKMWHAFELYVNCKTTRIYTAWTTVTFAISDSQFTCAHLFTKNSFIILSEPGCLFTRRLWIKQRSVHR